MHPRAPRCPSQSAPLACSCGLEGLAGTGCPPLPSLVMKGSAVRVRASALPSRKSLHNAKSCCLSRRRVHFTANEGVRGSSPRVGVPSRLSLKTGVSMRASTSSPPAMKDASAGSGRVQPRLSARHTNEQPQRDETSLIVVTGRRATRHDPASLQARAKPGRIVRAGRRGRRGRARPGPARKHRPRTASVLRS